MTSKDKALTTATPFAVTTYTPSEYLLPGERLSLSDLYRFKVPSGTSGAFWQLPSGEPAKTLHAVILHASRSRTYWIKTIEDGGGDSPPDCSSNDAIHGDGLYGFMTNEQGEFIVSNANPTGECKTCPMAAFGSGKGEAQACREGVRMLLLLSNDPLPTVLNIPPASLGSFRNYRLHVLQPLSIQPYTTTTLISLLPTKSKSGGVAYYEVHFDLGEALTAPMQAAVDEIRGLFAV